MALNVSNMKEDMIRRAFDLFDRDGDGKISQAELGDVLKTLNRSATEADIRELIGGSVSGMFTARGGSIDFETFKSMLVRHGCPNVATRRSGVARRQHAARHSSAMLCALLLPPFSFFLSLAHMHVACPLWLYVCRAATSRERARSPICRRPSKCWTRRTGVTLTP